MTRITRMQVNHRRDPRHPRLSSAVRGWDYHGTLPSSEANTDSTHFFRVRAALRAAATRPARPFVRAAFLAAAFREPAPRLRAAVRVCPESERLEAALRPSRRNAVRTALD